MVFKNPEEQQNQLSNILSDIIKKKYSFNNIFIFFLSIFLMGLSRTLNHEYTNLEDFCFILFMFSFVIFLFNTLIFILNSLEILFLIKWPSFRKILINLIQVFCFTLIFVLIIDLFQNFYNNYIDPFKEAKKLFSNFNII
ncbi:hypothetical protein FEF22_000755 [Texas Phoenix palm phytoplasma]|uniref:Preprotein translocase subunit SecE n=1 Tax=Texas Phoenix palm phytoplasma TaxID=176709 RepID=A0ABS5BIB2_9MOLU|nr:hypothetical protein [Texas Phoenix palm phytoplasma]MBP3059317.1 hypothetical protein [Texas Phoenix palm phytoplasma]